MATELELALFEQELVDVRAEPEARRWQLERDRDVPLGLFVALHPVSAPHELYKARLRWDDYFGPVSLKFVTLAENSDSDPEAWPQCFGFRPQSLDACLPWTREGHALHPEWRNSSTNSFPTVELPMRYALLQLQISMDNTYQGRGRR